MISPQSDPGSKRFKRNFGQNQKLLVLFIEEHHILKDLTPSGSDLMVLIFFMGLSKYCSYLAVLLFMAFILTVSAAVWGVLDKTGEVNNDQNDDDD